MNDPLTKDQKIYINELFQRYEDNLNKQYEDSVAPEIKMLSKYRGELARAYEGVREHRATLISCMQDVIEKQEELIGLCNQLATMGLRIERYFLNDIPPTKLADKEEVLDHE